MPNPTTLVVGSMGAALRRPDLLRTISACVYVGLGVLAALAGGAVADR